jgi:hypothetical protein
MFRPGMAALAGCRPIGERLEAPPSSGGMGDSGLSSESDSARIAGVVLDAGVPRTRVESPKRTSMSSRRTPQVSG